MIALSDVATPVRDQNGPAKIWSMAARVTILLMPFVVAFGTWTVATFNNHEVRLSVIEGNRFTAKDALQLERSFKDDLSLLRADVGKVLERLASIEARLSGEK